MIVAQGVRKEFSNHHGAKIVAINDFSLTVREKEFVSILGPSGCGKSTFLLLAAGLDRVTGGEIRVDGDRVTGPDPKRAIVFQEYLLFPWKSVRGNVEFGLEVRGVGKKERRRIGQHYIGLVGLEKFANRFPHELSGGMKQRVAIARALANEPRVLLMDEPFGALDALTRETLQMELQRIFKEANCTVLFVTHSISEAVYLSDRVVIMSRRPGRIKATLEIHIERPRKREHLHTDHFRQYEAALRSLVWDEVTERTENGV